MCLTYKCNISHFSFDFMNIQVHVKNVLWLSKDSAAFAKENRLFVGIRLVIVYVSVYFWKLLRI